MEEGNEISTRVMNSLDMSAESYKQAENLYQLDGSKLTAVYLMLKAIYWVLAGIGLTIASLKITPDSE